MMLHRFWISCVGLTVLLLLVGRSESSDDPSPLEAVVQQLTQKVQALEAKVTSQDSQLQKLQRTVQFAVQHSNTTFNVSHNDVLIFDVVRINDGGGYSTRHGEFTAPVAGMYVINLRAWSLKTQSGFLHLNQNDRMISEVPFGDEVHESASSESVLVHLSVGDILTVSLYALSGGGQITMMGDHRTTFMGYLLRAD